MSAAALPPAFLGGLWGIQVCRPRHSLVVGVELPLRDFDRLWLDIGRPACLAPDPDTATPTVLLLACRAPRPPEPDALVMAEAAIALLEQLVSTRALLLTPALALRFDAVREALDDAPIAGEGA